MASDAETEFLFAGVFFVIALPFITSPSLAMI
jgi:hypothetical protein